MKLRGGIEGANDKETIFVEDGKKEPTELFVTKQAPWVKFVRIKVGKNGLEALKSICIYVETLNSRLSGENRGTFVQHLLTFSATLKFKELF